MKKKYVIPIIILLIFFIIFIVMFFANKKESKPIELSKIVVENKDLLSLSEKEKKICIDKLIEYLNKEDYYECNKIVFYNNTFDKANNSKYFYALVIGADKSLIEITNNENENFSYSYIGNQLTKDNISKVTGVSYLQIVYPDEYKKEKELERMREESRGDLPDDTEMP